MIITKELKGFWDKSKGLINKLKPENVYFKTRCGIHTFGLKFPLDVVILDKNNKVKKIKESLKPNRIFLWNPKYEKILELKPGTIKKEKIKIDLILKFNI